MMWTNNKSIQALDLNNIPYWSYDSEYGTLNILLGQWLHFSGDEALEIYNLLVEKQNKKEIL